MKCNASVERAAWELRDVEFLDCFRSAVPRDTTKEERPQFLKYRTKLFLRSGKSVCKSVSWMLFMVEYIKPKSRQCSIVVKPLEPHSLGSNSCFLISSYRAYEQLGEILNLFKPCSFTSEMGIIIVLLHKIAVRITCVNASKNSTYHYYYY